MNRNLYTNLNPEDRGRIINLHNVGSTRTVIARIISYNRNIILLWVRKYEESGMENLKDHRKIIIAPKKEAIPEQLGNCRRHQ